MNLNSLHALRSKSKLRPEYKNKIERVMQSKLGLMNLNKLIALRSRRLSHENIINKVLRARLSNIELKVIANKAPQVYIRNVARKVGKIPSPKHVPLRAMLRVMLDPYSKKVTIPNLQHMAKITGNKKYANIAHERAFSALDIVPNIKKAKNVENLLKIINTSPIYTYSSGRGSLAMIFNTKKYGYLKIWRSSPEDRVFILKYFFPSWRNSGTLHTNISNENANTLWKHVVSRFHADQTELQATRINIPRIPRNLSWVHFDTRLEAIRNNGTMYKYFPASRRLVISKGTNHKTYSNINIAH